ncbi:MAG: hypothetical protein ACJAYU_002011 [Bradymonadia bacterium]
MPVESACLRGPAEQPPAADSGQADAAREFGGHLVRIRRATPAVVERGRGIPRHSANSFESTYEYRRKGTVLATARAILRRMKQTEHIFDRYQLSAWLEEISYPGAIGRSTTTPSFLRALADSLEARKDQMTDVPPLTWWVLAFTIEAALEYE